MSEDENFLSRWSRLKRESGMAGSSEEKRTVDTVPGMDMSPAAAFDVASLPPIESIVADSDIRPFLADGVPAELTRAALRSAWAADPAIRDFIGIAESQWDFNDPAAIPGFGPLGVAEYARALDNRAPASLNSAVEEMRESPAEAEPPTSASVVPSIDEVDLARAREYSLLSGLLLRSPDAQMLGQLAHLRGDGSPLGLAHAALAAAAAHTDAERAAREHFALFVGLGRGELLPYASYYLTGFLHGRPLARVRQVLQRIGVERADGQAEPEDHAAILLEIMAGLAGGAIAAPAGTDREIFEHHLAPWIGRFFADLEHTVSADFYSRVGMLGLTFIGLETQAFLLPQ
jgi:TorA maturation chaperone TorD